MTGFTLGTADGATLGTAHGGTLGDAAPETIAYRVTRDGATVEDAVYDVDPVVDTANPFGDYAVIKLDDRGGTKFAEYERGTRVDVDVLLPGATEAIERFTGYVVERRENEQAGADALEVEAYSFDQFLRRNTVTNDQRGNTISQALADIIQTDTPVSYAAGNVDVGDDQELTRSYQGEAVENVLRDFAFKSNNEGFGVNDDLEFFFRPPETRHIDRGIDNTQWFQYDIPELGKEAINEVEVWYDDGDKSVVVDDGGDKLDLQDSLGLPSPGTQRAELNRPLVTDLGDAEDIGRKYLAFKTATLSGTVTTFGLYDAQPGDTIDITIDARGINGEFIIAAVEYRWGVDETELTIVEKRGDVDDILTELSDSVQRVEMQSADRDAPSSRITTTSATAAISGSVAPTADGEKLTNAGRNVIRDAWTGAGVDPIDTLVYGDDASGLSRSNTALGNQTGSASVTTSLNGGTGVTFSASVDDTVQEVGLQTASGDLVYRAVFDSPISVTDVDVALSVADDSSERSVLTTAGQTAVRDILADNAPALPDQYAYGTDDTLPTESDTTLGNASVFQDLTDVLLESFFLQDDFEEFIAPIADDRPLTFNASGNLTQLQTTQLEEAEESPGDGTVVSTNIPGDYSSFDAVAFDGAGQSTSFTFRFDYRVPSGEATGDFYRGLDNFDGTITTRINGEQYTQSTFGGATADNTFAGGGLIDQEFEAGETIIFEFEITDHNSGRFILDTAQIHDNLNRFDNITSERNGTVDTSGSSNILTAPGLFPEVQAFDVPVVNTRRTFQEARAEAEYDDVSQNQFLELSNDGTNFTRTNNSETATATFGSATRELYARFSISHYEQNTVESPRFDASQTIDSLELFADVDAVTVDDIGATLTRAVIQGGDIAGDVLVESGILSNGTLLTRHVFAEFTVEQNQQIISAETTRFTGE